MTLPDAPDSTNGRSAGLRIAVLSVHGCPVVQAGEKDAGGMNVYVLETVRLLAQRGIEVDVYTRAHDPADPQVVNLHPGARVIHLEAGPVRPEKNAVYDLLPEFRERLLEFQRRDGVSYDLIYTHYWLSGLVGMELSRRWVAPHVTSFHTLAEVKRRARPGESEIPERAESERLIAGEADRIIAWSEHERGLLASLYDADPERVLVIPPGVDAEMFRPLDSQACREALGLPGDQRILMYVGRVERLKGLEILIHAVGCMEVEDNVCLLVVGGSTGDPEVDRLKTVASELEISDRVRFVGSVPRTRLPLYYSAADVCVFPSYYESFGLAALEASACGTPVVASRVGGLPSIVKEGDTGYLIPWRCPAPFVQRLEILLINDHLRETMGAAAHRHARSLGWDEAVNRLVEVFVSLVREHRSACDLAGCGRRG